MGGALGGELVMKASYLDPLSPVKAFRCSAPLSRSGQAELLQLFFLFLAEDERRKSDSDN